MSLNTNRHNAHKLLMKLIFCPTFNLKNRGIKHRLDFYPRVSDQYAHTEQTQKLQRSPLITIFNLARFQQFYRVSNPRVATIDNLIRLNSSVFNLNFPFGIASFYY